jgi:GNAT superfamily N-acetyltransferase
MEEMSQIDYIKHLTLVAIVGEFGFGQVVGVGEYFLVESNNMAEVAFSVSSDWQGKGLGSILMRKLAHAARENGISGLNAFVMPGNNSMINLFRTLPYKVRTVGYLEIELSCRFDELETNRKK